MASALPQHLLIVPRGAAEISEAAATAVRLSNEGERCLLWLNDMERYIGSGGLGLKDIRALLASRTVVLATMRSRIRQNFPEDELVRISEEFEVQRLWSEDELERARQQLRRRLDARLQLALTQADNFGVAETLATGPQLWKELKAASVVNGNPRGAALVWAAIDLTLAGLTDPLPVTLLETLHEDYLPGRNKSLIGPEPFEEAFLWATAPQDAVTRLLIQEGDGLRPFEYLLDAHLRERSASPQLLPERIWNIALEAGTAEQQRFSVAFAAYANSRLDVSRRALQPLTEAGNVQALRTMGLLYEKSDRTEAARWLHLAADSGDALSLRLIGDLHFRGQNGREADNWYRKAAEAGDEVAQSYFHGPTITPYPASQELPSDPQQTEYEDGDDRDVDDYGPTSRTLRVLEAAFIMIADTAYAELESIGDNRVNLSDNYSYPFSEMPVLTWGQNHQWRHQMARCFDDLANDIKAGEWPLPTCTAEEMAMHLALEEASAMVIADPEFVDDLVRDIAEAPNDYDWDLCLTLFLEDTDVLLLFEPWSQGIEDPENHIGQRLGIAGLEADQWFVPFRQGDARDPERGFRR
ncbi:tetratricopeptide repeat protein [Streptomyces rimosus]